MDLKQSLQEKKEVVSEFLKGFFAGKKQDWKDVNRWGIDAIDRLESFTLKGKMIRGSLVLWTAKMLDVPEEKVLPAAAAMELLQSALLIHDDIMDKDDFRRGVKSVHKQYEDIGSHEGVKDAGHCGTSMAICLGDLALFLAHEVLAECDDASVIQLYAELSSIVGLGQMQDVFWGFHDVVPDEQEILSMYKHKTATYTFCLPFLLAVRLSGKDELYDVFNDLGVLLGKLFQIKDDELGLYGAKGLGKPLGSDVLMGKKTLHYSLLLSLASDEDTKRLRTMQVSDELSKDALSFVKDLLETYKVRELVDKEVSVLLIATDSLIAGLPITDSWKKFLRSLVAFNQHRTK